MTYVEHATAIKMKIAGIVAVTQKIGSYVEIFNRVIVNQKHTLILKQRLVKVIKLYIQFII